MEMLEPDSFTMKRIRTLVKAVTELPTNMEQRYSIIDLSSVKAAFFIL
jgi:hypothetical protein